MNILSEKEVDQRYADEALDEARDIVSGLEVRLQKIRENTLDPAEAAALLVQDAANLRMKAKTISIPGLSPLSHRLDEYLASTKTVTTEHMDDLQLFIDRIASLLDGDTLPSEIIADVIRSMPHKSTFEVSDVTVTDTEVTLVFPQRSAARVVERELVACGYRISTVLDPLEAFEIVLESKPDLVVTTAIMPRLSGVDLACALTAMPSTRHIPVAVLTSLALDHPDLGNLPINVGLIRRGENFGTDLANVLQKFNIT